MKSILATTLLLTLPMAISAGTNGGTGPILDDPPIGVGDGWSDTTATPPAFFFDGPGSMNNEGPFTFNHPHPVRVSITDAFIPGDRFEIFNWGSSLGLTSVPELGILGSETGDPNVAWGDLAYSQGFFDLGPGAHSITISAVNSPHGSGRGYIRVDELPHRIPDSATGLLFPAAALGILVWVRRQK